MKEIKYKVLWIDDEEDTGMFIDRARDSYGIDIHQEFCYSSGEKYLKENLKLIDAVILDVNCKTNKDDAPNMCSFEGWFWRIDKLCRSEELIPWFVYTGGGYEGFSALCREIKIMQKEWDMENLFYDKSTKPDSMFEAIINEANKRHSTTLRMKYSELFSIDEKINGNLQNILELLESNDICDAYIFEEIRAALETLRYKMVTSCILPQELNEGIKTSHAAKFIIMPEMQKIIPLYIQQSYYSSVMISNEASHNGKRESEEGDEEWIDFENPPRARKDVQEGSAPYLRTSVANAFITFLFWLASLECEPENLEVRRAITEKAYQKFKRNDSKSNKYIQENKSDLIGKNFKVEMDESGIFHCGICEIPSVAACRFEGKEVTLTDVSKNKSCNRNKYPYFAKFKPIQ